MSEVKHNRRHRLLLYKDAVDRIWMPIFPVGLLLSLWMWFSGKYWPNIGFIPGTPPPYDLVIYLAIVLIFSLTLVCWIIRNMAYVQAKDDHLRVVTPFLAVKVSYRRIIRTYPGQMRQIFKPGAVKKSIRKMAEPYDGETVVVVEMKGYPLGKGILRFFLGEVMLQPEGEGLVLFVSDWMDLSTEIESRLGAAKQKHSRSQVEKTSEPSLLHSLRRK
jgi:hypothetical protein